MEQTKALNALEPFLALSKSATSPTAAIDLIQRATSAPNTFIFSPLLSTPQIQALRSSPATAPHFELLSHFCYGTYNDYTSAADTLPPLTPVQTQKLRQLSLLTHARDPKNLAYARLIQLLGLSDARELESLVTSAIYASLLTATLNPRDGLVAVSSVAPLRDVQPAQIPVLIGTLEEWAGRCSATLEGLEKQVAGIKANALRRHKEEVEWEGYVGEMIEKGEEAEGKMDRAPHGARRAGRGGKVPGAKRGFMGFGESARGGGDMDIDMEEDDGELREGAGARSQKKRGRGRGGLLGRS
ncbi:hypothetical protein V497_00490 [Pseudogymnoascus sp. VKM F-4516 (FW-969)]|nr:hypothetical protein V497_00490 [Pseudogymnoascus sp. VKM F-4516 (FW-969)]